MGSTEQKVPKTSSFCNKKNRKALNHSGLRASNQLVRMRSAVQIRPAAPKSSKTSVFGDFLLQKVVLRCGSKILTHTVTHVGTSSRSLASPWRAKLAPFTVPLFPNATRCAGLAFGEKTTGREDLTSRPVFCCLLLSYMT